MADVRWMEVSGTVAQDGSVILPPGVLETMGAGPGDEVFITCGSLQPVRAENSYGRFFSLRRGSGRRNAWSFQGRQS